MLLASCQNHEVKMRAFQTVPAYNKPDAALKTPDFVIQQGQVCFIGKEVYGKVDKFLAVRCENGFEGFVLDAEGFEVVK